VRRSKPQIPLELTSVEVDSDGTPTLRPLLNRGCVEPEDEATFSMASAKPWRESAEAHAARKWLITSESSISINITFMQQMLN